jgi:type IV pilus assembly protein PilX
MKASNATRQPQPIGGRQRGAALIIGLLLLLILTLLAVAGMNTATLELQMAGNEQYQQRAFEAAETAVEQAIDTGSYNTGTPDVHPQTTVPGTNDTWEYVMQFDADNGETPVPGGGYSLGSGFTAYHFNITAVGRSERGARAEHVQSVYIIGPSN